jgi:hypothetical protein
MIFGLARNRDTNFWPENIINVWQKNRRKAKGDPFGSPFAG